jgi:hypothetical protein
MSEGCCRICPHAEEVELEIEPEPDHLDAVGIFTPAQEQEPE